MSEPIHIISLGAGVQSSTMALMAAHGEITPMPNCAIFADTQDEPQNVYNWLEWLVKKLAFTTHIVTAGCLSDLICTPTKAKSREGYVSRCSIPAFTKDKATGKQGLSPRQCTSQFKVDPIHKKQRELVGKLKMSDWRKRHREALKKLCDYDKKIKEWKRNKKAGLLECAPWMPIEAWNECQNDALVISWLGISLDEVHRSKPSKLPWIKHRFPLLEKAIRRYQCEKWMANNGYMKPPRSACVQCPYRSNEEWLTLKQSPEDFQKAVRVDAAYREVRALLPQSKGIPYVHRSMLPLDQVDFGKSDEGSMFGNECDGLCGV